MSVITPSVAKQLKLQAQKLSNLDQQSLTSSYPPPAGFLEARNLLTKVARPRMTKEIVVELDQLSDNTEVKMKVTTRLTDQFVRTIISDLLNTWES